MRQIFANGAALVLAVSACQQGPNDNIAIDETNSLNAEIETLPADESSLNNVEAGNPAAAEAPGSVPDAALSVILPSQYKGRWGMVAADCTSTRGDAKGLIEISDQRIKFYEAVAILKEQRPASSTSFSGLFAFTGEGQSWEKVMTFARTGDTLKRSEESGTFTYKRCA